MTMKRSWPVLMKSQREEASALQSHSRSLAAHRYAGLLLILASFTVEQGIQEGAGQCMCRRKRAAGHFIIPAYTQVFLHFFRPELSDMAA